MADKSWGSKVFCECGTKYYTMNKKEKIVCPVCSSEYVPDDLVQRNQPVLVTKIETKKKIEDLDSIDDVSDSSSEDDMISLDDQKEIEETEENYKVE